MSCVDLERRLEYWVDGQPSIGQLVFVHGKICEPWQDFYQHEDGTFELKFDTIPAGLGVVIGATEKGYQIAIVLFDHEILYAGYESLSVLT